MNLQPYWLAVPLIGIDLTVPVWCTCRLCDPDILAMQAAEPGD